MIYADNAATTKISDSVLERMSPFLREQYGNASSQYSLGTKARRAIEQARLQFATALGAQPSEIFFTSGGSETNSWVLRNVTDFLRNGAVHIITSSVEHHSVLHACQNLEAHGVEVTYLPVDSNGVVCVDDLKSAIKPSTKLVSIMLANNEIGAIQPISEIGKYLHAQGILFHTDAVQAVGHIPIDVNALHVDFLTASAHKFNGPKGVGVLFKKANRCLPALIFGGEQEHGLRAGTENVAGIVGAGYAAKESISTIEDVSQRLNRLSQKTFYAIQEQIPTVRHNGALALRLPGMLNLGFDGISGEALMNLLDLKGVCVSTSSACNAGKNESSHVLLAIGQTEEQAKSAIRISYGRFNHEEDAIIISKAICDAYRKIKGIGAL